MLNESPNERTLQHVLEKLPSQVQLPADWSDFFMLAGPVGHEYSEQRRHARMYLRGRALLERRGNYHTVYTTDISRSGLGFLHFEQLFPRERLRLWLPQGLSLAISSARCRRVQDKCFTCGARIDLEADQSAVHQMMREAMHRLGVA